MFSRRPCPECAAGRTFGLECAADRTLGAERPHKPTRSYSHSMVPGGLLVMSSTTRLTSGTSLVMRVEMRSSTS
jgi:hypothetical protein